MPFAGIVISTDPLPGAGAVAGLTPRPSALDAVHVQPGSDVDAMMFTVAEAPPAGALTAVGLIAKAQLDPNCVNV